MHPISIPKLFTNGIRVNEGPLAGVLAQPCFCGKRLEEGETGVLVGSSTGDFYLLHREHTPAILMMGQDGEADSDF
jgi:hypothetical protein